MSFNYFDENDFFQKDNFSDYNNDDDSFIDMLKIKPEIPNFDMSNNLFHHFETQSTEFKTKQQINENKDFQNKTEIQCFDENSIENGQSNEIYMENFNCENQKVEFENEENKNEIIENKKEDDVKKVTNVLGRKKKNYIMEKGENIHTKSSTDNMVRKIKIHILLFITNLINDCIKLECKRQTHIIRGITKEITSDITINSNIELFDQKIDTILSNPINKKYKNKPSDENKKQILKIREKYDILKRTNELLDKTFEEVYYLFINGDKNELKQKYGLNEAETLNDFLSSISEKESEQYVKELEQKALKYKEFFDPKNARETKKDKKKKKKFK